MNELHPLMSKLAENYRLDDMNKKKPLLDSVKAITEKAREIMDGRNISKMSPSPKRQLLYYD